MHLLFDKKTSLLIMSLLFSLNKKLYMAYILNYTLLYIQGVEGISNI